MSLFIEEEGNIKLDFDTEEIATLVIDAALELADCPYEAEINLLLTENAQIHEMNLEQRGIDRPLSQRKKCYPRLKNMDIYPKESMLS